MPKLLAQVVYAFCALLFALCAVGGVAIFVENVTSDHVDVFLLLLAAGTTLCAICFAVVAAAAVPTGDFPEETNRAIGEFCCRYGFYP